MKRPKATEIVHDLNNVTLIYIFVYPAESGFVELFNRGRLNDRKIVLEPTSPFKAMMEVKSDRAFSEEQEKWLELIRRHLVENLIMEKEDIDSLPIFSREGASWDKLNKAFDGELEELIHEINAAVAA